MTATWRDADDQEVTCQGLMTLDVTYPGRYPSNVDEEHAEMPDENYKPTDHATGRLWNSGEEDAVTDIDCSTRCSAEIHRQPAGHINHYNYMSKT